MGRGGQMPAAGDKKARERERERERERAREREREGGARWTPLCRV